MSKYTQLILSEIKSRAQIIGSQKINTLYFGGGTPSLLPAEDIVTIRRAFENAGFDFSHISEISIEINPGTLNNKNLDLYLAAGVNRYSVGAQTFNDSFLKMCGREHSANDTRQTLRFLYDNKLHYSFDLLFGLPGQTRHDLLKDLEELITFNPDHVSLYNLTVPLSHKMNMGRASDEEQALMFIDIEAQLNKIGLYRYEISNFAKPGFESKHNQIYWSDGGYWGVGVSAHSYLPQLGPWGTRFWNPSSHIEYLRQVKEPLESKGLPSALPMRQIETLSQNESMTDYCHTQLRMLRGINKIAFQNKFGKAALVEFETRASSLLARNLLNTTPDGYKLSTQGIPLANQVFLDFTFV